MPDQSFAFAPKTKDNTTGNKMKKFILLLSILYLAGCAGMAQQGAIQRAYSAYQKGECNKVYTRLRAAEYYKEAKPELQSEITFLKSMCLEYENRPEEALKLLTYIVDNYPDTEYGYRSQVRIQLLTEE